MSSSSFLTFFSLSSFPQADKTALTLLSEVLVNTGSLKHISHRCLFIGLFRQDEVKDPLTIQLSYIQMMTGNVNTTVIELSSLTKTDVAEMLMSELRLPQRMVLELADAVVKKTSGHAFFIVQVSGQI